jgi:PIN domain nuclease of toxin-antitoxin system
VRFLLDTHAWIWAILDDRRLGRRARAALESLPAAERIGIAAISLKEAAWHVARGRVRLDPTAGPWEVWLRRAATAPQLEVLPLTVEVAIESERLVDPFPDDPADRLIAATARTLDLTLITRDRPMRKYPHLRTLW